MEELLKQIKSITNDELTRANSHFPLFPSAHEAYAVIKEEAEEVEDDRNRAGNVLCDFWNYVKRNEIKMQRRSLLELYERTAHQAAESVQVAAMALKAIQSLDAIENKKTCAEVEK